MRSTGGKTGGRKLGSLALSVDHLTMPDTSETNIHTPPLPNTPKDSYAERLAREHNKVLGTPNQEDGALLDQFIDPPELSVLKLEATQILETELSQKQLWDVVSTNKKSTAKAPKVEPISPPIPKEIHTPKAPPTLIVKKPKEVAQKTNEARPTSKPLTKTVAPRALPFSEETHVRVKVIRQDIDLNIGHVGASSSQSITWMQRDAIKHYLAIQDMERRRATVEGAVYRTFQHDA